MKTLGRVLTLAVLAIASLPCFAQKIKVGYDKGTDFSKFKTYSWAEPAMPPVRPALYEAVMGQVELQLESKGLTKVTKDGDLTLTPSGGVDYGFAGVASTPIAPTYNGPPASLNGGMWTGATGPSSGG